MTDRRLREHTKKSLPQCAAIVLEPERTPVARDLRMRANCARNGWQWDQCQRFATLVLDEDPLCNVHGGQRLVARHLGEPLPFRVRTTRW